MTVSAPVSQRRNRSPELLWFGAWAAVGVGLALGITALGLVAVPAAILVAILLVLRHHAGRSALGLLVGVGLLALYVAYVQRMGPGTVSWHTATASGSEQFLDPRPWLIAGILLVVAGVLAYAWRRRHSV